MIKKVLISSCLLGENVRYNGGNAKTKHTFIDKLTSEGRVISVCPEASAGCPIPRPSSEIVGSGGGTAVLEREAKILNAKGKNVTDKYIHGAQIVLKIAKKHKIKIAVLKDGSPSCGSINIYDGSFSNKKIKQEGVTAALLRSNGIKVFTEDQLEEVKKIFD